MRSYRNQDERRAITEKIATGGIIAAAVFVRDHYDEDSQRWYIERAKGWDNPDKKKAIAVFEYSPFLNVLRDALR